MTSTISKPRLLAAQAQHGFFMIGRLFGTLVHQRLGRLIPFVAILIMLAVILLALSTSNPLMPFLYPLL